MTPEQIKEVLEKSGYLFEQQVATQIEQFGYHVTTNKAYQDQEEGKSREIDIVAHKEYFRLSEWGQEAIGVCYLNCECKNSSSPLVFINRKKSLLDKSYTPDGIFLINDPYSKHTSNILFHKLGLFENHFATNTEHKAVQIWKINRNGNKTEAQHSGVIEGFIYPLVKSKKLWENQLPGDRDDKKYCKIIFNLVITNAPIYTIDSMDENALPKPCYYAPFIRELRTRDFNGEYLITFVQYKELKRFFENEIGCFMDAIKAKYEEKPELYSFLL
jgi:hypothetical protein